MTKKYFACLLILSIVSGCGGGGQRGNPPMPPPEQQNPPPPGSPRTDLSVRDTIPPTIASTVPMASATGVEQIVEIVVNFSEAVKPETITATSFTVSLGETRVPGQIVVAEDRRSARFLPERPLRSLSQYTGMIQTDVADLADNKLAVEFSWSFTTILDTTSPRVVSVTPAGDTVDVDNKPTITLQFSEEMNRESINAGSVQIKRRYFGRLQEEQWLPVEGSLTLDETGILATFIPSKRLALLTRHSIAVSTVARDLVGNELDPNHFSVFVTRDGIWQGPEKVEYDNSGSGVEPKVGISNEGDALVVWKHRLGSVGNIWANRYNVSENRWEGAAAIENDAGTAGNISLAQAPNGTAVAVWSQAEGAVRNIQANFFGGGEMRWQAEPSLIETGAGNADRPRVVYSETTNDYFATWPQSEEPTNLYLNHFSKDSEGVYRWEESPSLLDANEPDVSDPFLSANPLGQVFALWLQEGDFYMNVYLEGGWVAEAPVAPFISATELFEEDRLITALDIGEGSDLRLGSPLGHFILIPERLIGNLVIPISNSVTRDTRLFAMAFGLEQRPYILGAFQAPDGRIKTANGEIRGADLVQDDSANVFAIWSQGSRTRFQVYAQRFDPRAERDSRRGVWDALAFPLGVSGQLNTPPRIGVDNNGNALVVFGVGGNFMANRFRVDTRWRTQNNQALFELDNLDSTIHPQDYDIAVNDDGYAVAVWVQSEGRGAAARANVFAARFE